MGFKGKRSEKRHESESHLKKSKKSLPAKATRKFKRKGDKQIEKFIATNATKKVVGKKVGPRGEEDENAPPAPPKKNLGGRARRRI